MTSPAIELAQYLADVGVASSSGGDGAWSVHVSREPLEPPEVITLYDTTGRDLELVDEQLRHPGIQVRVRARDYAEGYAKQQAIFDALAVPTSQIIGAHWYVAVALVGDILSLGRTDRDRHLLTANYLIERQPVEV